MLLKWDVSGKYKNTLRASGVTSAGKQSAPPTTDITGQSTNQESEDIRKPCASLTVHNLCKLSSEHPQTNEERRSDKNVSCLFDLLEHYCPADRRSVNGSVYEPMSSSLVPVGFESKRPAHSAHALLYENCLHCRRGENSCHLPKPTPPTRRQECFQKDQSKDLRNHSNISESTRFSAEHLSISLQPTCEEGKKTTVWTFQTRLMSNFIFFFEELHSCVLLYSFLLLLFVPLDSLTFLLHTFVILSTSSWGLTPGWTFCWRTFHLCWTLITFFPFSEME